MTLPRTTNDWSDFWRYEVGVNVIPADTKNKTTWIKWSEFQNEPTPAELHQTWKKNYDFAKGMAIILGRTWHSLRKKDLFLAFVDLDNQKAIEEFCFRNGKKLSLEEVSKTMIVEQHKDQPDKAHVYFFTRRPITKKSSDKGNLQLASKLNANEIPAIEVKGSGEHGIAFCTPSPHMNGCNYEIIGTTEPEIYDDIEQHIDNICKKYGISYLDGSNNNRSLIPIQDLFKEDTKIFEGHNRHEALLRVMESLIGRNFNILDLNQIERFAYDWNQHHCVSPLSDSVFQRQWKDAIRFIEKSNSASENNKESRDTGNEPDNNTFVNKEKDRTKENEKAKGRILTVSQAARLNTGIHKLRGNIFGISELYHMIGASKAVCTCGLVMSNIHNPPVDYSSYKNSGRCSSCGKSVKFDLSDIPAVTIELRDADSFNDLDKIRAVLFDKDTYDVPVGENATLSGEIAITEIKGKGFAVMYVKTIKSESQKELKLSSVDKREIKELAKSKGDEVIKELVSLTMPNIIGHEIIKEGILLSAVSTKEDQPKQKRRIHILFIGPPGVAKTDILTSAIELVPGSTFQSGQSSTGLSLTALVVREDDKYMLRVGPIPKARGKICAINEINRQSPSDQDKILDFMQEGQSNPNKYGIGTRIRGPTTIIGSANPRNGSFSESQDGKVDLNEVDIIAPLRDRFDLIFILKRETDPEKIRNYAHKKGLQANNSHRKSSPTLLVKYLMYAKQLNPEIDELALSILNECYVSLVTQKKDSPRTLETLWNLARARARLRLKKVVGEIDAKETVEYYGRVVHDYHTQTVTASDPRDVAVSKMEELLSSAEKFGEITFSDLVKSACENDNQVALYIGNNFSMNSNHKLRPIAEILQRNTRIKQTKMKPLTFRWVTAPEVASHEETKEAM